MRKILILIITLFANGYFLNGQNSFIINTAGNTFSIDTLTITVGDTVTWNNTAGMHNINATLATYPNNPEGFGNAVADSGWSFQWIFTIPGTYDYQCDPHAGIGMTAVIIANPIISTCNKSIDQELNGFNPDPVYAPMVWSYDTISLTNTSNCDLRIRPEFHVSHDSQIIDLTDFDLKWYNPYFGNWPDIPHHIDINGDIVGFFGLGGDSSGTQITQGSTQQIIIRIRFRPSANYGTYSANWITQEVDSIGNIIQAITTGDSTSISFFNFDCSIFNVDSSYSSNISCYNDNNGSASIVSVQNGSNDYLYNWSNGDTTSITNNLQEGNYFCIVTDKNWQQCSDTIVFTISEPNELTSTYTQTNVSCYGANDGGAIVNFSGGTSGSSIGDTNYILGWAGTTQPIYLPYPQTVFNTAILPPPYNEVPPGIYPYSVTDLNGCVINDTIVITQPDSLFLSLSADTICCPGGNSGSIFSTISGGTAPYSYEWGNGQNTQTVSGLSAGNYNCIVTDANGCIIEDSITVYEYENIINSFTITNPLCSLDSNGCIYTSTTGGDGNYTYQWSNGEATADICNLSAGSYTCVVTDGCGCFMSYTILLSEPNEISLNMDSLTDITVYGGNNGSIYISSYGGSGILNISWTSDNGFLSNDSDIINLSAGFYYLEITDSNSCTYLDTFELSQPSSLWINLDSSSNTSCFDSCDGELNITANGGDSTYTYNWTGPNSFTSTNNDLTNLCFGTYIIIVNDGITTITDTFNVFQPQPITTLLSVDSIICHNGTAQAEINVWGGTQPFIYDWSNGGNSYITTVNSGNYAINVTDQNGCTVSQSFSLLNPDSIFTQTNSTNISCFGGNNGSISINISNGGIPPYNFSNDNGMNYQVSNTFNNLDTGNYYFLISDSNGCLSSVSAELIEPSAIISATTTTDVSCYGYCNGSVTATASGGTIPYSYTWTNGTSNLCAGIYNLMITDINGCVASNSAIVNEPNPILINIWIDDSNIIATSGFTSYQWYDNNNNPINGATDSIFTPLEMGYYYVTVTDTNTCSTDSYSIEYIISTIEEYFSSINIFPNPTNGSIIINSEYGIKTIKLYNIIGNELYLVNNNENKTTETKLDLSNFAKGVYFIKININNQIINQRIILQ